MTNENSCVIALTADLHIGDKTTSAGIDELFTKIQDENVDALCIAGDIFDRANIGSNRKSTGSAYHDLIKGMNSLTCPIYLIPGNHDISSMNQENALELLRHKCTIINTPQLVHLDYSCDAFFLPWTHSTHITIPHVDYSSKANILIGHCNIKGTKINEFYALQGTNYEIKPEDYRLKGYDYCAFGHIHKRTGDYIGAPWHLTYGDVGNPTGFEVLTVKDKTVQAKYVELTVAPKFYKIGTLEEAAQVRGIDHVNLVVDTTVNVPSEVLAARPNLVITKTHKREAQSARTQLNICSNVPEMFEVWACSKPLAAQALKRLKSDNHPLLTQNGGPTTGSLEKIISIKIINVGPHAHTHVTNIDKCSNLSITGCNGSGKTFFIDSIFAAWYGVFPSRSNTVFAYSTGKKSQIILEFEANQQQYKIERIFNAKSKHNANLYLGDTLIAGPKLGEVNTEIEKILGHKDIVEASIFSAQKNDKDLVDAKPANRKELFQKVLNTEPLLDIGTYYKEVKKEQVSKLTILAHTFSLIDETTATVKKLEAQQLEERKHQASLVELQQDIAFKMAEIVTKGKEIAASILELGTPSQVLKMLDATIQELESEKQAHLAAYNEADRKLQSHLDSEESETFYEPLIKNAVTHFNSYADISQQLAKLVPELDKAKALLKSDLADLKGTYELANSRLEAKLCALNTDIKILTKDIESLDAAGCKPDYLDCSFISKAASAPNDLKKANAELDLTKIAIQKHDLKHKTDIQLVNDNFNKKFNIVDMQQKIQELQTERNALPSTSINMNYIDELRQKLAACASQTSTKESLRELCRRATADVEKVDKKINDTKKKRDNIFSQVTEYDDKCAAKQILLDEYASMQSKQTQNNAAIIGHDQQIIKTECALSTAKDQQAEMIAAQKTATTVAGEIEILDLLIAGFSKDGIPQLITDNAFPQIQEILDELLVSMNIPFGVTFKTQKLNKQKNFAETLDIVVNDGDSYRDITDLSPGEKALLKAAIRIAISIFQTQRSNNKHKVMIVDEVFDALDSTKINDIVYALSLLSSKYDFNQVIAVSHNNDLVEAFTSNVIFSKVNGVTTFAQTI